MSQVTAIDLFCGFGGSSQGIHRSGAEVKLAANHNDLALDVHALNFPDTEHLRADLSNPDQADYVDPQDLPAVNFLWASPSCTHHSQANATKLYQQGPSLFDQYDPEFDEVEYARSERSRVTMVCPLRYAAKHLPELVVVENVVEVTRWGPGQDGSTFRWWLDEWAKLGYDYECKFLNSQFFPPTPQSRDRIYVCLWRKGNTKPDLEHRPAAICTSDRCGGSMIEAVQSFREPTRAWPMVRWGKYGSQYVYRCPSCGNEVDPVAWPSMVAIDWSDLGIAVGERVELGLQPLATSTRERIRRGLAKYGNLPPLVIPNRTHATAWPTSGPTPTVVAGNISLGLADATELTAATMPFAGNTFERPGKVRSRHVGEPLFTQHTTAAHGLVSMPFVSTMRGSGERDTEESMLGQLSTVTAGGFHHGLAVPSLVKVTDPGDDKAKNRSLLEPSWTTTTKNPVALMAPGAMWAKQNGGPLDTTYHRTDERPFGTVTSRDTHGLVVAPWLEQFCSNPTAVTEQMATMLTHARHALALAEPSDVSDDDIDAVRFRMLKPEPELRRAMAFGDDYHLAGNKTQMTAGLGNAVTPPVAEWLTERMLATLDVKGAKR